MRRIFTVAVALALALVADASPRAEVARSSVQRAPAEVSTILYGASYYSEYLPAELGPERVAVDAGLMREAGVNVVRMGESSWGLMEPADGRFDFAWLDRAIATFHQAGVKVVLGTPTYSMPAWMAKAHPELLARPLGGAAVGYGMRQNMNYDDPLFRRYAERMISTMVAHYRDNPAVIGWQLDNETGPYGAANDDVFAAFVEHLKHKFGSPEALNAAWTLNYWGQSIHDWSDMPRPDFTVSPSYKLEWARFQQQRVTTYLAWQSATVRRLKGPDQFVLHDFASAMRTDVDEFAVAPTLDVAGINVYHAVQDGMDGAWQALQGDYARSLKRQNYFVTETSAQTIGWNAQGQYPPDDGQLRLDAYADIAGGANMVLYWHWASLPAGLETYWKGVLGHDYLPGRAYREVSRTGGELRRLAGSIANLTVPAEVAILYSPDSNNALNFMPYRKENEVGWRPEQTVGYASTLRQLHRALYQADVAVDFLPVNASAEDLARYRLLVVPSLYVADDALLGRIDGYVRGGGHVLATFKSGFANPNNAVRATLAPGPLAKAAGFTYQEFSSLEAPVALKGDPFGVGEANRVSDWMEFLDLKGARALASYDDPRLSPWPAITQNVYGRGTFTYEASALSDRLQYAVVRQVLAASGLASDLPVSPGVVRARTAVDGAGRTLRFLMNFSSAPAAIPYRHAPGQDLLTGRAIARGETLEAPPWGLFIVRETVAR